MLQTHIADKYDEAHKGRAVILKGFWQNLWHNVLPSIFSWNDTPFTQARKNGNMTWSQFLLGGKLGTPPQTTQSKFVSSLDEEMALKLGDIGAIRSSTAKIFNSGVKPPPQTSTPLAESKRVEVDNAHVSASQTVVTDAEEVQCPTSRGP